MVQQGTQTVTPPPTDPDMLSQPTVGQRAAAGAAPPPAAPPPSTPAAAPAASGPAKGGDEPDSKKYRLMAFIKALSGGGTPAINASLEQHYARQRAQAQLAEQQVQQLANAYAAEKDPAKRQELAHQWETAKENYLKVIGKDKNAKGIGQKTIGVLEKLVGHGGGGMTGGAAGAASPQGGGGGGAAPAASGGGGGAAPTQQGSQTVPPPPQLATAPKPTVPPPPGAGGAPPWQLDAMGAPERERMRKEEDARNLKDEEYRDKLKADIDPHLRPPHVNELKQEIDDIMEAEPGISRDDAIRKAEQKLQITPKPGSAKLKTGWGKDDKGFYSFQIGTDNHPVAGSEDRTGLPPASYLEHTREGFHYITDDDGNVHEIPNESKSGVAIPGGSSGKPSSGGSGRVVGHSATAPQKKVEEAADALETEARKVDKYVAEPSPTNDTALLFSYVRAQVAGAGRMTNTEIQLALKAGSWGTQLKNYYDRATKGELDPEFRKQAAQSVKTAALAAREEADKYRKPRGQTVSAPPSSSKSIDDEIMEAVHGQSGKH